MGKKVLLMVALALALPMAAFADSDITFTSNNGTLVGSSYGMSLSGDQLMTISGLGGSFSGTDLGTLTFTTDLMRPPGNVVQGATFFAPGGSVSIAGNGSNGAPSGVLFSGAFSQNPSWTRTTMPDGSYHYTFTGLATGVMADGSTTADMLIVVILDKFNGDVFGGKSAIKNMTATIVRVPEPGTIGFMGAGLIGLVGAIRRKYKSVT